MSQSVVHKQLNRIMAALQGGWLLIILVSLTFNMHSNHQHMLDIADAAAQTVIDQEIRAHRWTAEKGDIYIVSNEKTPPSPYLHRDLTAQDNPELALLNPTYLLRDIQQRSSDGLLIRTHLISENPFTPVNQPDDWEAQALQRFKMNPDPVNEVQSIDSRLYLRKVQPLTLEPDCMACHAGQGYQVDDIRGGISTAIPMAPYLVHYEDHKVELYITHLGIWLLVSLALSAGYIKQRKALKKYQQDQHELELSAQFFDHSYEGILITDANARILKVNQAFERLSGYNSEELIGLNPRILKSGRQKSEFYQTMWQSLTQHGHWQGEVWNRRKDGEIYAVVQTISVLYDTSNPPKVRYYLALCADITRLKNKENELNKLAHYDPLTELPNRQLATERLQQAVLSADQNKHILAVVLLDLDGFKSINEQHDYQTGDLFLIALAQRLLEVVAKQGMLSRISGDEFALFIYPVAARNDCEPLLDELLTQISQPIVINGQPLQVTASIGATFYPSDLSDAEQLLRHADQAMFTAKQKGKNSYSVFDAQEDQAIRDLSSLAHNIERALEHQEFVLFFQPKVNTADHHIIGAEALIRWQHPIQGLLFPDQFLPMIEREPVMLKIGRWVMRSALEQLKAWCLAGIQCPVSINLHSKQLQEMGFLEELSTLLEQYPEVDPGQLEIEVLETTAVEDMDRTSYALQGIRDLGVQVSIDDFGTGYSSLTYLKNLPVNTLKIDQSFVRDLLKGHNDMAIVQGVISMAAAFKLNVIAEGVETQQHAVKLMELGCIQVQGYGISKPLPVDKLEQWLEEWKKSPKWLH